MNFGAAALAAVVFAGTAASAATFNLIGGDTYALPGPAATRAQSAYNPDIGTPDVAIGAILGLNAALSLDGPAKVTFTYFGSEATYTNFLLVNGTRYFSNKATNDPFTLDLGAGVLDFGFETTTGDVGTFLNGLTSGYFGSIALLQTAPSTVYALFNDAWGVQPRQFGGDRDFDDMVVRLDVAPVPLPAAAFLLMGALGSFGGLAVIGRRRAARAA